MGRKEKIEKWIDLSKLPKWEKGEGNGKPGSINWNKCSGYKVKFAYDDIKGEVEIIKSISPYLYIKYLDKDNFKIMRSSFAKCCLGELLNKKTSDFKIEIGQTFKDDKRDIIIINRRSENIKRKNGRNENKKLYKYHCNICGYECGEHYKNGEYQEELLIPEFHLLRGHGCSLCSNQIVVKGLNDVATTHPWMKRFFNNQEDSKKYSYNSDKKIIFKCPDCGIVKDKPITIGGLYKTRSVNCPCGDGISYPEKFMYNILQQLNIEFKTQYSPDYLGLKKSDFYIPSMNLIIETDGALGHEGGRIHNKSKKTIDELIEVDNWKDKQHELHGLHTIRIDCFESDCEYIKQDIVNKLSNCFDFSNINWYITDEYATFTNKKKEICDYWSSHKGVKLPSEISKELNYACDKTIRDYLKQGNKFGWCIPLYKPQDGSKEVEIFKDEISLGIFSSCNELERQSLELFGVRLDNRHISNVANGKRNHHHGFVFKYTEELAQEPNPNQTQSA